MAAPIPKQIGRYEIIELVGRGGMGVLYRGRDKSLERDVAVKMMLVDFTSDPSARERFEREAKAVARLQHRNVVTIHELGDADGAPYIVMEFLSGKDLDTLLKSETPITLGDKLDIAVQLCEGLGYAHEQGIVHRDIKPGNVRVLEDGTVKILDFGIAKFAVSSVTLSGTIMGTPSYMAPEQIMGQPVDGRADLFSAGVLLYEILTGKKPFTGDQPTTVVYQIMHTEPPSVRDSVPELPEALHEIVSRALQKNPNERYSRASEMASDLQMVKMMLDLPLNNSTSGAPAAGGQGSAATTGKLFATTMRERTATGGAPSPVLNQRMRASAVAAAADAAPRADSERKGSKGLIWAVAAAVVLLASVGIWLATRGTSTPVDASTTAGGPAGGGGAAARGAGGGATAGSDLIAINSTPAGAKIVLNGVDTGKVTPAPLSLGGKVPSTIELSLAGYQPVSGTLTDADLRTGNKEFRLSRETGPVRLTVSGPYAFDLYQGDKVVSASSTKHQVTIQPGGAAVSARNKELLLNMPIPLDFQRPSVEATVGAPGKLNAFASGQLEACAILADGTELGFSPVLNKAIAAGLHTVSIKCPDGKTESQKVTVGAGESQRVTFGGGGF
jgi:predicted Ser/Thr protein kinase